MKTPKSIKEKETAIGKSAGGKITKNKAKGKNQPGNQVDAAKAKLGLQKAKDTVKVQDGKNVKKKSDMKNKVFNGKGSPVNGSGGKKRKSDEGVKPDVKKSKGAAPAAGKSPEVQLGLKIEKMLESVKNVKKNRKRGKKNADATPEVQTPVAGSPGKTKNKKKRSKKSKNSEGSEVSSPVAAKPAVNQQKKIKLPAAPKPKFDKSHSDAPVPMGSFPSRVNAENAIKALLKHLKEHKAKKPTALLDDYEPLMVSVDFFKKPEGARKLQRVLLPHQMLGNNPDIIFVATDDKKAKKDFDESIEKHKELFKTHGIDNICEIIPWRKLCQEYTQYEEKRKLANRADAFLIDSKLSHRWPAVMRKKFFKKKAPTPVRTDKPDDLKDNVNLALRKVPIILGGLNSLTVSPQFGNSKMNVKSLADNLITVVTVLCEQSRYPGGQANIRQIIVRGGKSEGFPVFVSTVSPNTVDIPKISKKKKAVVEGEVTTAGVSVRVHPSGHVQIKSKDKDFDEEEGNSSPKKKTVKNQEDSDEDDSEDEDDDSSEIDADLLEKFQKANKASEDESSEDEEEIEKAEQEFLLALRNQQDALEAERLVKNKKAGKKAPVVKEDSSDEDDDLDGEDDSDVPDLIPAKKSKPQTQPAKKGKNAKQAPGGVKPVQNGVGKGKPGKGKPGKQGQSPKGAGPKKGFQGGKGNANQKGNNKGSPKGKKSFNKGGKKK